MPRNLSFPARWRETTRECVLCARRRENARLRIADGSLFRKSNRNLSPKISICIRCLFSEASIGVSPPLPSVPVRVERTIDRSPEIVYRRGCGVNRVEKSLLDGSRTGPSLSITSRWRGIGPIPSGDERGFSSRGEDGQKMSEKQWGWFADDGRRR